MKSSACGGNKSTWNRLTRIMVLVATAGVLFAMHTLVSVAVAVDTTEAADKPVAATGVAITSPTEGQSLVHTNVEISGTAPAGVLIAIIITDADTSQPLVEHQPFGKIQGNVTSDQDGRWVFTPQQAVVPSSFQVQATYVTTDNQEVSSRTIQFVATTSSGSAHVFSRSTIVGILFIAGGLFLFFLWLIIVLFRHHRRKRREATNAYRDMERGNAPGQERHDTAQHERESEHESESAPVHGKPLFMGTAEGQQYKEQQDVRMKAFEEETFRIEDELARTAQELERANAQVIALRTRFTEQGTQHDTSDTESSPNRIKHKK